MNVIETILFMRNYLGFYMNVIILITFMQAGKRLGFSRLGGFGRSQINSEATLS